MAFVSDDLLTLEERDELRMEVSITIKTILGLAELIERSMDSVDRLDAINLDAVNDLSLKLANLSRYSDHAHKKIEDFMTVLAERWDEEEETEVKFKVRYDNTMTSYLLDETFDSEEEAYKFINENFFEGDLQFYEVEVAQ